MKSTNFTLRMTQYVVVWILDHLEED